MVVLGGVKTQTDKSRILPKWITSLSGYIQTWYILGAGGVGGWGKEFFRVVPVIDYT